MKTVPGISFLAMSIFWLFAGEVLAVFNRTAYENSQGDGIGVLEVVEGAETPEGRPRLFVPLRRTELRGEVVGPLASLRLVQVYGYSRKQSEKVIEALYRFPLPGDAAVVGVRVRPARSGGRDAEEPGIRPGVYDSPGGHARGGVLFYRVLPSLQGGSGRQTGGDGLD